MRIFRPFALDNFHKYEYVFVRKYKNVDERQILSDITSL